MRWWWIALVVGLAGQVATPGGTVRGVLLEWDAALSGALSVRVKDNHVYCFRFDPGTTVERDGARVPLSALRKGDMVEVVSQASAGVKMEYAREVRVIVSRPPLPAARHRRGPASDGDALDELFPRGDLTLSGVVVELSREALLLRTRLGGDTRVVLRDDTRYVRDGRQVAAAVLRVNARVFVRGGRNLDDDIEAYQVMWGKILKPAQVQ